LAEALHDLITAVVAGSDEHLSSSIFNLFGLHPAVVDALLSIWCRPSTTTGAAAVVVGPVGIHVHIIIHTLLGNPARLFVIPVAESTLTFTGVVAGIVVGGEFGMFRFVQFDASGFNVFFEKIMNAQKLDTLVSEPILQTKPGRKVGVASLR
jgi:hypothetical protein